MGALELEDLPTYAYDNIIKDCFWDLKYSKHDIEDIVKGNDINKKAFLFSKILLNSTNLLVDLNVFDKEDLISLIERYKIPKFNSEYIFRRKNIVEVYFLNKPLLIEELKWVA